MDHTEEPCGIEDARIQRVRPNEPPHSSAADEAYTSVGPHAHSTIGSHPALVNLFLGVCAVFSASRPTGVKIERPGVRASAARVQRLRELEPS